MPIPHKFINNDFENGFATNSAILDQTPYKPEVLIIGTFNPDTPNNFADFFYGRNFFWTAFKRLSNPYYIFHNDRRMPAHGVAQEPLDPTLQEIWSLCEKFKLSFGDLILEVLPNDPLPALLPNGQVIFDGQIFNLIRDNALGGVLGLANLHQLGQVLWNTENIIEYLIRTPSIKYIYLTRQPAGIWGLQWNIIITHPALQGRGFQSIVTPSGNGIQNLPAPFNTRLTTILHYWVWNGMNHPFEPLNNVGYGHLDHEWLQQCGVDINQF